MERTNEIWTPSDLFTEENVALSRSVWERLHGGESCCLWSWTRPQLTNCRLVHTESRFPPTEHSTSEVGTLPPVVDTAQCAQYALRTDGHLNIPSRKLCQNWQKPIAGSSYHIQHTCHCQALPWQWPGLVRSFDSWYEWLECLAWPGMSLYSRLRHRRCNVQTRKWKTNSWATTIVHTSISLLQRVFHRWFGSSGAVAVGNGSLLVTSQPTLAYRLLLLERSLIYCTSP